MVSLKTKIMSKKSSDFFSFLGKINFHKFSKLKITTIALGLVVIFSLWLMPVSAVETGLSYGTYTGLGTQDLRIMIMRIIRIFLGFVGIIAILINLYAGYLWMTAGGNEQKIATAKKILTNGIIGLLIIFSAFSIVSFILSALGVQGSNRYVGPTGPPGFSDGALGGGIIESVYPAPYASEVPRQTDILVTFKIEMDAGSVCDDKNNNNLCEGEPLRAGSVLIFKSDDGETKALPAAGVLVTTQDRKTFTFDPVDYLGDGVKNTWYEVKLTNTIKKDNGQNAFSGVNNYFKWPFEVGTLLDLDPVETENLFPQPDNSPDNYSQSAAVSAFASVRILSLPQVKVDASFSAVSTDVGPAEIKISGSYNCLGDGSVSITAGSPTSGSISTSPTNLGFYSSWTLSGSKAPIGCGLTLESAGPADIAPGNLWTFTVTAAKTADTLVVANKTYTFVGSAPAAGQISLGSGLNETAANIKNKINSDNLSVGSTATGANVNLTSKLAGKAGNTIALGASGSWAQLSSFSGGADAVLSSQVSGVPDKPRNVVIKIDFNEAINPTEVNAGNIKIEYDKEPDPARPSDWVAVNGKYLLSNQYKTVEFLPDSQCGICSDNGQPCGSNGDCSAPATCSFITNSCGDKVYCLPVMQDGNSATTAYDPTKYRVSIRSGLLKNCTSAESCLDGNFKVCAETPATADPGSICQGTFNQTAVFYPEVASAPLGIRDIAHNSFNGNKNTYTLNTKVFGNAEGPQSQSGQPAYNLNSPDVSGQGDDMFFSFYINKQIDLSPPKITEISPTIGQAAASLSDPVTAKFNKLLMSSTVKPGTGYRDGYCYCNDDADCSENHLCDVKTNKCKSQQGASQFFCAEDSECKDWDGSGPQVPRCWNQKYISLINQATFAVGWWAGNESLDTVEPKDGYGDVTKAILSHTRLGQVTQYGAEFGSGILDVYQNCYLPSGGRQNSSSAECLVTELKPYCCNGAALNRVDWENSQCFTGY